MEATASAPHDRTRYEGRNLLWLLLAFLGPAFVLFLKFVLNIAERSRSVTAQQLSWLRLGSYAILAVFFLLEVFCAHYVQRLLRPARTRVIEALHYLGVLLLCLFTSYCGAVACEAFGYEVFLRVAQH